MLHVGLRVAGRVQRLLHGLLVQHVCRRSEVVQRVPTGLQMVRGMVSGQRTGLVVQTGGQDRASQSDVRQEQRMGMMHWLLLMLQVVVMMMMRLVQWLVQRLVLRLVTECSRMVMQVMR